MHATPPTCMHALQIQTNIMYTTLLLAPLTPILQPPKQKRTPLAESYRRIFSATVVVETAEKRGQKWKRCDSSFSSSVEETQRERAEVDNEEGAADRGSLSINKILAFQQSESVRLRSCVWGIKRGRVYARACPPEACAQYTSVTNCRGCVLSGNPRHPWMTHEKSTNLPAEGRGEEWGCREKSRDLQEQRASAASFQILTEADYAPHSALTYLGQIHKPRRVDMCVCNIIP